MNLDKVLDIITTAIWILLAILSSLSFFHNVRRYSLPRAIKSVVSYRMLLLLLMAASLSLLSASLIFIEPQKIGVVVSLLSPKGYRDQPLRSGLRFVVPLAEQASIYPIYWQSYTMSGRSMEGNVVGNDAIVARTKDGQEVLLDCTVIFRVDTEQVVQVHIDWQHRYIQDLVRPRTRGLVRTLVSKYTVTEVNSDKRTALESELQADLSKILEDEGFLLNAFVLRNIAFSSEYAAAVEAKQVAFEGQHQKEYEAQQIRLLAAGQADKIRQIAQADAEALLVKAEAKAKARRIQAEAEKEALLMIHEALAHNPHLLTYEYIDKLAPGIKAMIVPQNTPLFLPIPTDQLFGSQAITSTATLTGTMPAPSLP